LLENAVSKHSLAPLAGEPQHYSPSPLVGEGGPALSGSTGLAAVLVEG
jgi:hypothetical protein